MALICDIATEVENGLTTTGGAVDLVWINGANFKAAKNSGLLYGPWATLIPAAANFDFTDTSISFDRGTPIAGMEFPFHQAQAVFIYNTEHIVNPPMNILEFRFWIQNSGQNRFAYSDPTTDFTGAGFVRHFFCHFAGPCSDFLSASDDEWEALYDARAPAVWDALNLIEPLLYAPSDFTPTAEITGWYPESHDPFIRDLVGGTTPTLWMDFSMQASEATTQQNGDDPLTRWPETTQAYVMESGTLADTSYLAIPINAPNKEAALVAVNHIGSAGAMFTRSKPEEWGALQAFDPTAPSIMEWDPAFDYINQHQATPTVEELAAGRMADLRSELITRINAGWASCVLASCV